MPERVINEIIILKMSFFDAPYSLSYDWRLLNFVSNRILIEVIRQKSYFSLIPKSMNEKVLLTTNLDYQYKLKRKILRKNFNVLLLSEKITAKKKMKEKINLSQIKSLRRNNVKKQFSFQFACFLKIQKLISILANNSQIKTTPKMLKFFFDNTKNEKNIFKYPKFHYYFKKKNSPPLFYPHEFSIYKIRETILIKNLFKVPNDICYPKALSCSRSIFYHYGSTRGATIHLASLNITCHSVVNSERYLIFYPKISDRIVWSSNIPRINFSNIIPKENLIQIYYKKDVQKFDIVLESNFRLYAHSINGKNFDIINIFSEPIYKLGSFYMGEINYKSISRASRLGINSSSIIKFIEGHLNRLIPEIPKIVINQIILWENRYNKNHLRKSIFICDPRKFSKEKISINSKF